MGRKSQSANSCARGRWRTRGILLLLLLLGTFLCLFTISSKHNSLTTSTPSKTTVKLRALNSTQINHGLSTSCRFHTCFDIRRCVFSVEDVVGVHVGEWCQFQGPQTPRDVMTPKTSLEYEELVEAVKGSRYYVSDPASACIFIPPLDTLGQSSVDMGTMLNSLPQWSDGGNYLLFNMLPGNPPHFNVTPDFYYGKAMLAGAGFTPARYRSGYDLSIPVFNPLTRSDRLAEMATSSERPRLLTVLVHGEYSEWEVQSVSQERKEVDLLLLKTACSNIPLQQLPNKRCGLWSDHTYSYPEVLLSSKFCLLLWGAQTGMLDFTDMMMTGCIPVVVSDVVLPFSEVLDWTLASIRCPSCDLRGVVSLLRRLPAAMVLEWREQVRSLYYRHFHSMATIVMTTLHILNERVFPISARSSDWWNKGYELSHVARDLDFLPLPSKEGFTAVILTYNRVDSLFKVIENVAKAPSCVRIVVVWNNVATPPPSANNWPKVRQGIDVIRSKENKLSNRFYPYDNLTSAVLSLDDDITMLTTDELEFGFKAWQEFPNRLVGFPGRVHSMVGKGSAVKGNRWKYESVWYNNISLVLTGAAFYHKYYNYLYTHEMPAKIRDWVDLHMNCEDIAMNFLISNYTGLPPLKVSPRKKFVCPSCSSKSSLWTDSKHYVERDECITVFEQFFGGMPLKTVKFRLDPILYKTASHLQDYPHMGEL